MLRPIYLFLIIGFLASCGYESKDDLRPDPCVPDEVSYSRDLKQHLDAYGCVNCHNDQITSGGVDLLGYDMVKFQVDQGVFLQSIRHEDGAEPMPLGSDKMEPCEIRQFEKWIRNGAPNN